MAKSRFEALKELCEANDCLINVESTVFDDIVIVKVTNKCQEIWQFVYLPKEDQAEEEVDFELCAKFVTKKIKNSSFCSDKKIKRNIAN